MDIKVCRNCKTPLNIGKEITELRFKRSDYICKPCLKEHSSKWRATRKEELKDYRKKYRKDNIDTLTEYDRERYKKNKDKVKKYVTEYQFERRKLDPIFKLSMDTRNLINQSFKRTLKGKYKKSKKTEEILGCTLLEFINHLESLFKKGMSIGNHGEWHIDHIIPISSAKNIKEVYKLNHYTNLQPLWASENLKKSNKIT
jgi:hypothetical protein